MSDWREKQTKIHNNNQELYDVETVERIILESSGKGK